MFTTQREIFPPDEGLKVSVKYLESLAVFSEHLDPCLLYNTSPITISCVDFQRKELEDFKEQVRVRKEKRILKDISMENGN